MKRTLFLVPAAALASVVLAPVLPAQTAYATPLCQDVGVSGIVTVDPNPVCVPYPFEPSCSVGGVGQPGVLYVSNQICVPALLAEVGY